MDTAMRDLERIEEGDATGGRSALVFVLATVVTGGLVYGVAQLLNGGAVEAAAHDPLDALGSGSQLAAAAGAAAESPDDAIDVDRAALAFPERLGGDPRPEVEASFAAAAAEHAQLEAGVALVGAEIAARRQPVDALPAAALATPEGDALAQTAEEDALVSAALPVAPDEPREQGQVGTDGRFTLQVASYRTRTEANAFAEALRDRGHDAFVLRADVEGRGVFHRVRIGPFETGGAAESYRASFERTERMDTFVVRRRD